MKKILVICDDLWHPAEIIEQGFSYIAGKDYCPKCWRTIP